MLTKIKREMQTVVDLLHLLMGRRALISIHHGRMIRLLQERRIVLTLN